MSAKTATWIRRAAIKAAGLGACICVILPLYGNPRRELTGTPGNLDELNATVQPGDVVILEDGRYGTPISPAVSGTKDAPITYQARNDKGAVFEGGDMAIQLSKRSWVEIRGIKATNTKRFIMADGSDHITIDACHFENTESYGGWENCRFRNVGDGIRITRNVFKRGTDLVSIGPGDFHLIEGNTFDTAEHTPLVLLGVQRSVVRNNTFNNPVQRCMEVFSSRYKDQGRPTRHCVIEGNTFTTGIQKEPVMGKKTSSHAIKISSREVIYRRNLINHCQAAVNWSRTQNPNQEAKWNTGNRFYHNTINDCGYEQGLKYTVAMGAAGAVVDESFGDNVVVNNVFSGNHFYEGILLKDLPRTVCVAFLRPCVPEAFRYRSNLFQSDFPGAALFGETGQGPSRAYSLVEFEERHPQAADGNVEGEPRYRDASTGDFRLQAGSAAIDAGRWLTRTMAGSDGRLVAVEDATYFTDGYGLIAGDRIDVGRHRGLRVVHADYENHRLELDRAIEVTAGEGVTLAFEGAGPDMGAFEFGAETLAGSDEPPATPASQDLVSATAGMVDPVETFSERCLVLVFVRRDCPISNRYLPKLKELSGANADAGVRFLLVYDEPGIDVEQARQHGRDYGVDLPFCCDAGSRLARKLEATVTPECVVFVRDSNGDPLRVYQGRIDDRFVGFGQWRQAASDDNLRDVLKAVVAGDVHVFPSRPAIGCYIESSRQ